MAQISEKKALGILRRSPKKFLLKTTKNKLVSSRIKRLTKKVLKERGR